MRPEFLALYATPDQIMGVTSVFATIAGLAIMFWNKVLTFFGKLANKIHPSSTPQPEIKKVSGQD